MNSLDNLSALEAASLIRKGDITSRALTEFYFQRIKAVEHAVCSFITLLEESALKQADIIDEKRLRGEPLGPLAGLPVAIKDNICVRGTLTTAGSRILNNFRPPYDATVTAKLLQADAVIVGKTNLDEFAMGSSTENSGYHTTHNPWDLDRVPGGSSGGSAAAVAAGEAILSVGSDTGGSIRQPASLCGIVGMKPTYGRVSRYGLIAYASSLDQIGPFSHTVADCALALNVICGYDPMDSTSTQTTVSDFLSSLTGDVRGMRIGVPKEYFGAGVAAEVASTVHDAINILNQLGVVTEECSLPTTEYALAAYYILAPAECSSNLARFDGVRYGMRTKELTGHIGMTERTRDEGFGQEVKQRIMIGTYALSAGYYDAYYRRAQQTRTLIRRDFSEAFEKFDALLTPTSPTTAFKIGEKADPLEMKLADICTIPVNMAGLPAISIPCGFVEGLPVGMQLIGKPYGEAAILNIAHAYEQAAGWHKHRPLT